MQGRAKAHGIPWNSEEKDALKRGVSPEDVRAGLLDKKDVASADKKEKEKGKSLFRMKRDELMEMAKDMDISFDEEAVTRQALIHEISEKRKEDETSTS